MILLVEDEDNDIFFVKRATERAKAGHTLHAVKDGEEAIHYLRGEGMYADRQKFPVPNVILTDLKMPGMGGMELLKWLRTHPECGVIPTIVFSSSSVESDVRGAYKEGANSYITKPSTIEELSEVLRRLYDYWSVCECPPVPVNC